MTDAIKILITGDFYAGGRTDKLIRSDQYQDVFGDSMSFLKGNDLVITNLESAITETVTSIPKTGPAIKAHPKTAEALNYAGFNLVSLANNHIMDFGSAGLESTLDYCNRSGIEFIGAGLSLQEARKPIYKEYHGRTIAVLNFCENEWSTTQGDYPGANPLNPVTNSNDIKQACSKVDIGIVILHGGNELYSLPSPRLQEICRFYIDSGASVVVCHHAHFYSGFEEYNSGKIFYGLGNFVFDNPRFRTGKWNQGFALQLSISGVSISYKLFPYIQSAEKPGIRQMSDSEMLEFETSIEALNKIIADHGLLQSEFDAFCKKVGRQYLNYLEPYSNRLLNGLYKRGLLPSLLTGNKKMLYQNLIRCEAHRDVLLKILEK